MLAACRSWLKQRLVEIDDDQLYEDYDQDVSELLSSLLPQNTHNFFNVQPVQMLTSSLEH